MGDTRRNDDKPEAHVLNGMGSNTESTCFAKTVLIIDEEGKVLYLALPNNTADSPFVEEHSEDKEDSPLLKQKEFTHGYIAIEGKFCGIKSQMILMQEFISEQSNHPGLWNIFIINGRQPKPGPDNQPKSYMSGISQLIPDFEFDVNWRRLLEPDPQNPEVLTVAIENRARMGEIAYYSGECCSRLTRAEAIAMANSHDTLDGLKFNFKGQASNKFRTAQSYRQSLETEIYPTDAATKKPPIGVYIPEELLIRDRKCYDKETRFYSPHSGIDERSIGRKIPASPHTPEDRRNKLTMGFWNEERNEKKSEQPETEPVSPKSSPKSPSPSPSPSHSPKDDDAALG